jgi:hypothetical protein
MKIINVLRDNGANFAKLDQFGDSHMSSVWTDGANFIIHGKFPTPRFNAIVLAGEEILKHYRRHARPHAAGAAKVWYATIRAHTSAGKHHRILTFFHPLAENKAHKINWL